MKTTRTTNRLCLDDFDFSGFSSSKGWAGFFEQKGRFSLDLVEKSISIFHKYFERDYTNFCVMTALWFNDDDNIRDEDKKILGAYSEIYFRMKSDGILVPINDETADIRDDMKNTPYRYLQFNNYQYMDDMARIMMTDWRVVGQQCFFINTSLNIALYPHDATGYGAIGLNGQGEHAVAFLEYCKAFPEFDVQIKGQNWTPRGR